MSLAGVTPLILTYNEDANIGRVLDRLAWAKHILIVDSGSTDDTLEIARRHPSVEIIERPFDNHVNQWNFGLERIQSPWVLTLDADYVLTDAFVDELRRVLTAPTADAYSIPFRYCVHGRPLRGSLYPPRLALFRIHVARYVADGHTQRLNFAGEPARFTARILHDDRKPLDAWLRAQLRYAALEAEKLNATPSSKLGFTDRLRNTGIVAPFATPLYCLFVKGLVLDGWRGWYYTAQRTYAELLLALRVLEQSLAAE